jgi:hypothetical protein
MMVLLKIYTPREEYINRHEFERKNIEDKYILRG